MYHLIVKSLHRNESFLSAGVERITATLRGCGQKVGIRDLYDQQFQPVLTTDDFLLLRSGKLPVDIKKEQELLRQADIIWFVYPVWWSGMPAILKGYIDRIFSNGFAYTMQDYRPVGLLKDKKAILINSMGMSYEEYKEKGMFEAMRLTIDEGIFGFTGMEVILHKYYTSIMSADDSVKAVYLDELSILAQSFVENEADCTGDKKDRKVA